MHLMLCFFLGHLHAGLHEDTFDLTNDNFKETMIEFIDKPETTLPLVINLVLGECTTGDCVRYAKEVHQFAKIVKTQNRVAHVDCRGEDRVCANVPKPKTRNNCATIYVTKDAIYGYDGDQTKEGLLNWMSAENFKESEHLEDPLQQYVERATGLSMPLEARIRKWKGETILWAELWTKKQFKKVPYVDRWQPPAKISLLAVLVIPPILFLMFYICVAIQVKYHNFKVDRKYEKMNKEAENQMQLKKD